MDESSRRIKRCIPYDIWHNQKCPNCYRTLSVGPVMLSTEESFLCGRCVKGKSIKNKMFVKSLYNIVACGYAYPCLYSYLGCDKQLSIFEMINHEQDCLAGELSFSEKRCTFCDFKTTMMIALVMHMRRNHLREAIFEGAKILFSITVDRRLVTVHFLENGIFAMRLEYHKPTMNLLITINCLTKVRPRLFSIKITNPGDPTNYIILQSGNRFNLSSVIISNNFNQLNDTLGFTSVLSYQLIIENLDFDLNEHDLLLRHIDLRKTEQECEIMQGKLHIARNTLNNQYEMHERMLDILKYIAPSIMRCSNCDMIKPGMKHYSCSEGHICCKACMHSKCKACNEIREFNSVFELQTLEVLCDWPDCRDSIELHYYLSHKASCSHRTYICPIKGCFKYLTSIMDLTEHWHSAAPGLLVQDFNAIFHKGNQEFFWAFNRDIYRVLLKIGEKIQVIVEDFDVILSKTKISCYGLKGSIKEKIPSSIFGGYFQVFMDNRPSENSDQFVYEGVEIELVNSVLA